MKRRIFAALTVIFVIFFCGCEKEAEDGFPAIDPSQVDYLAFNFDPYPAELPSRETVENIHRKELFFWLSTIEPKPVPYGTDLSGEAYCLDLILAGNRYLRMGYVEGEGEYNYILINTLWYSVPKSAGSLCDVTGIGPTDTNFAQHSPSSENFSRRIRYSKE